MKDSTGSNGSVLAFSVFSTTLFIFGLSATNVFGDSSTGTLIPMGLFCGGLILLLAGVASYKGNDMFTAVTSLAYAGFWFAYGGTLYLQHGGVTSSANDQGVFYLAWAVFTLYIWVASWKKGMTINLHFLLWLVALILLFLGAFTSTTVLTQIGGWCAFASALVGWYVAAGGIFSETFGKSILGTGKGSPKSNTSST